MELVTLPMLHCIIRMLVRRVLTVGRADATGCEVAVGGCQRGHG